MKYYVLLIVTYKDGTKDKLATYTYDTDNEALANFHKYLSQYIDAENVATVNVEKKNNLGGDFISETWVADVVEVSEV